MEKFVKGDVVVLQFPYSDLSSTKKRPAVVIATLSGDDVILCQITSQQRNDRYSLQLLISDFKQGALPHESTIRPNRLFTADSKIIDYKAGILRDKKTKEIEKKLVDIITA